MSLTSYDLCACVTRWLSPLVYVATPLLKHNNSNADSDTCLTFSVGESLLGCSSLWWVKKIFLCSCSLGLFIADTRRMLLSFSRFIAMGRCCLGNGSSVTRLQLNCWLYTLRMTGRQKAITCVCHPVLSYSFLTLFFM